MSTNKSRWFETPGSGFGYASRFYLKVFQSLKQEESLDLNASLPPMKTSWFLDQNKFDQWRSLLSYDGAPQAFTYSAPASVWALMQVLKDIGISFSRIMHMSSKLAMPGEAGFQVNQHYSTFVHYLGARPHSKNAVLIRFKSVVKDVTGRELMTLEDELYVAGLDEAFVKSIHEDAGRPPRRPSRSQLSNNPMADKIPVSIARNTGQKYGKLSGDLNPMHISSVGARLFGHKKAFVQGLCTLNIIIAQLGTHWKGSIRALDIDFIRPVAQPSNATLLCTLDKFELVDEDGALLVSGSYQYG